MLRTLSPCGGKWDLLLSRPSYNCSLSFYDSSSIPLYSKCISGFFKKKYIMAGLLVYSVCVDPTKSSDSYKTGHGVFDNGWKSPSSKVNSKAPMAFNWTVLNLWSQSKLQGTLMCTRRSRIPKAYTDDSPANSSPVLPTRERRWYSLPIFFKRCKISVHFVICWVLCPVQRLFYRLL